MRMPLRSGILTAALGLALLSAGCAENNEQSAGISGKAPEGGGPKSQADLGAQMKGAGADYKTQGYPGAK